MASACSTPSKSSSSSVGAAAVIAVGCTIVAAVFAAALVESDGGDLAARHQEHREWGLWLDMSLRVQKLWSLSKRDRWTRLEGIAKIRINTSDIHFRKCFIQLPHTLEIRIILSHDDLLIFTVYHPSTPSLIRSSCPQPLRLVNDKHVQPR